MNSRISCTLGVELVALVGRFVDDDLGHAVGDALRVREAFILRTARDGTRDRDGIETCLALDEKFGFVALLPFSVQSILTKV